MDNPTAPNPPAATAKKILCLEDEVFISELYSRALKNAGYDVTVESDGQKGLEMAQSDAYDIVLLDLMMPNVTGPDILAALRDPARTPSFRAKVVITTNLEQSDEARSTIEKQADGYLVKANMTPRELVEFVNQLG